MAGDTMVYCGYFYDGLGGESKTNTLYIKFISTDRPPPTFSEDIHRGFKIKYRHMKRRF